MTPNTARRRLARSLTLLILALGPAARAAADHRGPSDRQPGPTSPQGGSLATNPGSPGPAPDLTTPGATTPSDREPGPTSPQGGSLATNASRTPPQRLRLGRYHEVYPTDEHPAAMCRRGGCAEPGEGP